MSSLTNLKTILQVIELLLSSLTPSRIKLKNRNTKKFSTQYSKIHNVWNPIKDYRTLKKKEKRNHNEKEKQPVETDPELT